VQKLINRSADKAPFSVVSDAASRFTSTPARSELIAVQSAQKFGQLKIKMLHVHVATFLKIGVLFFPEANESFHQSHYIFTV
jgi:hypothetical protein